MAEINTKAQAVNTSISDIVTVAEKSATVTAMSALIASYPFFGLPVIKQITNMAVSTTLGILGNQLSIGLQQVGTFLVIDTQITKEQNGVSKTLGALMLAEKKGNQDDIKKAIEAYANAQEALTHDDGSAPPI